MAEDPVVVFRRFPVDIYVRSHSMEGIVMHRDQQWLACGRQFPTFKMH
jgi:hypothetical protein